jgi:copper homeostasis protein
MTADRILLEVCVDTPAGLAAAIAGGADRIELCAALGQQGLTPAPGLIAQAAKAQIPIYAMIRPRQGDFRYDPVELDAMRRDIDAVRAAGLAGVVFGANRDNGELDADVLAPLIAHAQGLGVTLHRAFDLVPNFDAGLELAIDLGFERVLTSGGAQTAVAGGERIAALAAQARGRIAMLAGGGINPANAADLIARTGVTEVHGSCSGPLPPVDHASRAHELGFVPDGLRDTRREIVEDLVRVLRQL